MRLIDADALARKYAPSVGRVTYLYVLKDICEAPAIDAEPVRHSCWVLDRLSGEYVCPECLTLGSPRWKRCPICEAKMDGGDE